MTQVDAPTRPTVVVGEDDVNARSLIVELLDSLGYAVAADVGTGQDTVRLTRELQPDVVLLDVHLPDGGGIEAAEAIARDNPGVAVVLYSGDADTTLSDSQVSSTAAVAFLPKPTPPTMLDATLRMAISRARQLMAARGDATAARSQLEQRKLIERAKGILMRRQGLGEAEAFERMRKTAMDKGLKLADVAQRILDVADLLS